MKAIEIITDGSYLGQKVGIGYVRIHPRNKDGDLEFTAKSDFLELCKPSHYGSQAAEAAAVIIALNELHDEDYTGDVLVYCDLIDLVKYINGQTNRVDPSIQLVFEELDNCIDRHSSVRALHPKSATDDIPKFLFAIAHNASAMESGAKKREKTTPEYYGKSMSEINTKELGKKKVTRRRKGQLTP